MIATTVNIEYKYGDTFTILPISDIHLGNATCDVKKLKADLEAHYTDKTLFIGVGDWLDMLIVSDQKRYNKEHDATEGNDIIDQQIERCREIFEPYKSGIIGIGDGNHEEVITRKCSTNPIKRLCAALSTETHPVIYLGYSWLLDVVFSENGARARTLTIRGHHGWGGNSRTQGADITKYSHDVKFWRADLFLYGHVHKLKLDDIEEGRKVGKDGWKTFNKRMLVCGTYQRTYGEGTTATWAETKGFHPAKIAHPIVYATPLANGGVDIKSLV